MDRKTSYIVPAAIALFLIAAYAVLTK